MTKADFVDGNHARLFTHHSMLVSNSEYVCDHRFQGVVLGVVAMFPYDYRNDGDLVTITQRIARKLFIEVEEERIDWVTTDGIVNQEWEFIQDMAGQWLRAWCSARKIQRIYREYLEYRKLRLRIRARVAIPRIVQLLKGCA
jgi:hypothetical protein